MCGYCGFWRGERGRRLFELVTGGIWLASGRPEGQVLPCLAQTLEVEVHRSTCFQYVQMPGIAGCSARLWLEGSLLQQVGAMWCAFSVSNESKFWKTVFHSRHQTRAVCDLTSPCRALPTSEWCTSTRTQTVTSCAMLCALCCLLCRLCLLPPPPPPCSQAVLLSEKRGKERAARLAAARAGKPAAGGKPKKSEAQKKVARDFYNQVCGADSRHMRRTREHARGGAFFGGGGANSDTGGTTHT